jgi:hypothetical protein
MGHPIVDNRTPFAFEPAFLADEEMRPLLVTLVRATFEIAGPRLLLAEKQAPVCLAGELHGEDAATSSWRLEPETAFVKLATDVVLLGHAYAPRAGATEVAVGIQVGPVSRSLRVVGDRWWVRGAGGMAMSPAQPFEKIPLTWERAFGGFDATAGSPEAPAFDPRNPVGTGYRAHAGHHEDAVRLPNLEDPADPVRAFAHPVTPAGVGFTSANWQPRVSLAGTFDAAWSRDRAPLLPRDFDRRFFNAAAPGMIAPGLLRGDEPVTVVGASPHGTQRFRLPGVPRPVCRVALRRGPEAVVQTQLDTVVVSADEGKLYLTWRGHTALRNGPHDVQAITIETPGMAWEKR